MAYDLALDAKTHDLLINDRDAMLIDNAERVAQQIKITLLFWLGEWFLDTRDGVPYLEYILVKNPNMAHIRQIFHKKISGVPDVNRVQSLNLQINQRERTLTVDFSADTTFGLVTQKEVLGYGRD